MHKKPPFEDWLITTITTMTLGIAGWTLGKVYSMNARLAVVEDRLGIRSSTAQRAEPQGPIEGAMGFPTPHFHKKDKP